MANQVSQDIEATTYRRKSLVAGAGRWVDGELRPPKVVSIAKQGWAALPGAFHFYPTGENLERTQDSDRQDAPVQRPPPKSHLTPPGSRIQDISKRSLP